MHNLESGRSAPADSARTRARGRATRLLLVSSLVLVMLSQSAIAAPVGSPGPHPGALIPSHAVAERLAVTSGTHGLSAKHSPPGASPSYPLSWFASHRPQSWHGGGAPGAAFAQSALRAASHSPSLGPISRAACTGARPTIVASNATSLLCYGHEDGIQFYSNAPASGGNVSWNVTLPVDRSSTENQSDLYAAVWFGLTLSDPAAYLGQCEFELQLYPDSSWLSPGTTVSGSWIAAALGWQIDPVSGHEDPCFDVPMRPVGAPSSFLNMTQGDRLTVTRTGWAGSPTGEVVNLTDLTLGITSSITLFNSSGNFPLDPAYSTNSYPNALEWSASGELPIAFAFETGLAVSSTIPSNNSLGGCSPGVPPGGVFNPAIPCPSYDPASWINDTLSPWRIGVPTFFSALGRTTPAQLGFTQDFGGVRLIDSAPGAACDNRVGSSYCTYPWYSFACSSHTFEFGATDYTDVSNDFGRSLEFVQNPEANVAQSPFFPMSNFSVPSCPGAGDTLHLAVSPAASGSSILALSHSYTVATALNGLSGGVYSVSARPAPGASFLQWNISGSLLIDYPMSPNASVTVTGSGTLTADFGSNPTLPDVYFNDSPLSGRIALTNSSLFSTGVPVGTFASGDSLSLLPGVYSVQAYPPAGSVFTRWTATGGLLVAAASLPFTWITVTGSTEVATLTAHYAVSAGMASVTLSTIGNGTVFLNGSPTTSQLVKVGSYNVSENPAPGWAFLGWNYTPLALLTDFGSATNVSLGAGPSNLTAVFAALVHTAISPAGGGLIAIDGSVPFVNGGIDRLTPSLYRVTAVPAPGFAFVKWSVSNPGALSVNRSNVANTHLKVNDTGTLTANFVMSFNETVTFMDSPSTGGSIMFNVLNNYTGTNFAADAAA
ncbi:MAG: hypothetical protein L3K09_05340, partial [Thermoplasmata archaeon]|nr:hypothetical protein [Thermoplasmata archaeon]